MKPKTKQPEKRHKFTGDLVKPVQVNFTVAQKRGLVEKSKEYGVPLATLVRMTALKGLGLK